MTSEFSPLRFFFPLKYVTKINPLVKIYGEVCPIYIVYFTLL